MTDFAQARQQVLQAMAGACAQAGRSPDAVGLLAVSKTQPVASLRALYEAGQRHFGENHVQEAQAKQRALADLAVVWHLIGPLQRNKTREAAACFAWVHSVDRLLIAQRLSDQRPTEQPPLNLCVQVNIDLEPSKSGCRPSELPELVAAVSGLPHVQLRGLMVIPKPDHDDAFLRAAALFEQVRPHHQQPAHWDTLSMGMSGDFVGAIAAGSTWVRIGTALFGARHAKTQAVDVNPGGTA